MADEKEPEGSKASRGDAAEGAERDPAATGPKAENEPEGEPGQVPRSHGHPGPDTPSKPGPEELSRETLMKKAYQTVDKKLTDDPSKAIDDLVKLMKLEKDLGGEQRDVKEIKVRWESSEDKSSSEG